MPKYKPTIYLAYGSNLNLRQMSYRCPTAEVVGPAELTGYDLKFRGGDGHAVATVESGDGSVPVLLWQIGPRDEMALDRYEGWPHLYRKESVTVELNGKPVDAMVYIMNEGHDLGQPSQRYFGTILDGYDAAGFDDTVLFEALDRSQPEMAQEPEFGLDWDWC